RIERALPVRPGCQLRQQGSSRVRLVAATMQPTVGQGPLEPDQKFFTLGSPGGAGLGFTLCPSLASGSLGGAIIPVRWGGRLVRPLPHTVGQPIRTVGAIEQRLQ